MAARSGTNLHPRRPRVASETLEWSQWPHETTNIGTPERVFFEVVDEIVDDAVPDLATRLDIGMRHEPTSRTRLLKRILKIDERIRVLKRSAKRHGTRAG